MQPTLLRSQIKPSGRRSGRAINNGADAVNRYLSGCYANAVLTATQMQSPG